MSWKGQLQNDPLPWLPESENPGDRYPTLLDLSPDDMNACEKRLTKFGSVKNNPWVG